MLCSCITVPWIVCQNLGCVEFTLPSVPFPSPTPWKCLPQVTICLSWKNPCTDYSFVPSTPFPLGKNVNLYIPGRNLKRIVRHYSVKNRVRFHKSVVSVWRYFIRFSFLTKGHRRFDRGNIFLRWDSFRFRVQVLQCYLSHQLAPILFKWTFKRFRWSNAKMIVVFGIFIISDFLLSIEKKRLVLEKSERRPSTLDNTVLCIHPYWVSGLDSVKY